MEYSQHTEYAIPVVHSVLLPRCGPQHLRSGNHSSLSFHLWARPRRSCRNTLPHWHRHLALHTERGRLASAAARRASLVRRRSYVALFHSNRLDWTIGTTQCESVFPMTQPSYFLRRSITAEVMALTPVRM